MTEMGLKVTVGPGEERVEVRDTVPENMSRLVKVTMILPEDPGATVSVVELSVILKSGTTTVTVTVTKCVPGDPVPVTVTE
jgi:hypothetical protein